MALNKKHPRYEELQTRLNAMRNRISQKREEAKVLFAQVLKDLGIGQGKAIPETLKAQLTEIKEALKINDDVDKDKSKIEQYIAQITTEDILKAIESIVAPHESKEKINAKIMYEKLRKEIAARMAIEHSALPNKLNEVAQAGDFVNMLNNAFKDITNHFGGAEKLLSKSMKLAEETGQITSTLSKIKTDLSTTAATPIPNAIEPSISSVKC